MPILASLYKENPDRYAIKSCISDDIIRPELPAVFDLLLFFCLSGKGGSAYFTVLSLEAGLAVSLAKCEIAKLICLNINNELLK